MRRRYERYFSYHLDQMMGEVFASIALLNTSVHDKINLLYYEYETEISLNLSLNTISLNFHNISIFHVGSKIC